MDLKQFHEHFTREFDGFKGLLQQQSTEIKQYGETTSKTAQAIAGAEARILELNDQLKSIQGRVDEFEKAGQRPDYGAMTGEVKSTGRAFTESDAYKNMIVGKKATSEPFSVKSLHPRQAKDLTSAANSGGVLVRPMRFPEIIAQPLRQVRVCDLIPSATTESNAIEYVEETVFTNAAAPVAENAPRPQSNLVFDLKTTAIKTIGHWIPVSRQILSDASQVQAYIDNRLLQGLDLTKEAQCLYGDNTGANLQGIMTHPGIQSYLWSAGKVGDTKIDAIRRSMTKARIAEYPVTGVVLHPTDWEEIELQKGSDGKYIWTLVTIGGEQRLWRVPVVDTTAINEGEALTGAFGLGAMMWDREDAMVRVSEQHADFFIKGMAAVLAEERLALTIFRPKSFVAVTFDAAPVRGS